MDWGGGVCARVKCVCAGVFASIPCDGFRVKFRVPNLMMYLTIRFSFFSPAHGGGGPHSARFPTEASFAHSPLLVIVLFIYPSQV